MARKKKGKSTFTKLKLRKPHRPKGAGSGDIQTISALIK